MPMNCGACNFGARTRRVFASTSTPIPTTKHSSQAQRKSTLNTWLPHMASLRGRVEQHEDITMPSLRQRCVRTFNAVSYLGNVRRYIVDLPPYRDSSMDLKYLTHVAAGFYPACLCHDGLYRFSKVFVAPRGVDGRIFCEHSIVGTKAARGWGLTMYLRRALLFHLPPKASTAPPAPHLSRRPQGLSAQVLVKLSTDCSSAPEYMFKLRYQS